jgi:hypothetical protein
MSNNRSSIESDYVFVDNPGQDELQEDYGFVIVARDAESPEVVQRPHELESKSCALVETGSEEVTQYSVQASFEPQVICPTNRRPNSSETSTGLPGDQRGKRDESYGAT